jgi:hypothetical protein
MSAIGYSQASHNCCNNESNSTYDSVAADSFMGNYSATAYEELQPVLKELASTCDALSPPSRAHFISETKIVLAQAKALRARRSSSPISCIPP